MSTVVAAVANGAIHMMSDSAITYSNYQADGGSKVFSIGDELLIGYVGQPRFAQIIRYQTAWPDIPRHMADPLGFMVGVASAIRQATKEQGYAKNEMEADYLESEALIGFGGLLFRLESNFQIIQQNEIAAIGSGSQFAIGALLGSSLKNPRRRLENALRVAEECDIYTRPPFHYYILEGGGK